jgi:hypothetical protein
MELGLNPRIIIKRTHSYGDQSPTRPPATKEARPAYSTKCLNCTLAFAEDTNEFLSLKQSELFSGYKGLCTDGGARMFAATRAVTVTRADKRRPNFKSDATT